VPAGTGLPCCLRHAGSSTGGFVTRHVFLVSRASQKNDGVSEEKFRTKRNKALEFKYYKLINIADELSWFPPKRITWGKRTPLAGFAHELRKLRNYVHPGVLAPERPTSMRFAKHVYNVAYEIFDVANSWLLHRVHESLRRRLEKDGMP
jgi:hypothetical protein